MLTAIVIIIVLSIIAVLGIAAMRPDSFRVEREVSIDAPPEKIFPLLADFRNWTQWSPWEQMDPNLRRSYDGPASGPGAIYSWVGNKKVGQGRMEILDAEHPSRLRIKLDFLKPFEAHNTTDFTLMKKGSATQVNWAMHGQSPFMFKLMHMFFDMDKMVGKDFEKGLANMKAVAEGEPRTIRDERSTS